jgi:hemolysin activation/secretion protein
MNKLSLALALVLALVLAGPAVALAAPADASYAIGVHGAPTWTVKVTNGRFTPRQLTRYLDGAHGQFGPREGAGIAQVLGQAYAANGAASIAIQVDEATRTVSVVEGHTAGNGGDYAGYLGAHAHLTQRQIHAAARTLSDRARADNAKVDLTIGKPDAEAAVAVTALATPVTDSRFSGAVGYTNEGARYAGSDLVTANGHGNLGHGNVLDLNAAHGLSNASSDSFGGRYNAVSAALTHYSAFGGTKIYASNTTYQTGGPLRDYDLSGRVSTWGLQQVIPLSKAWTVYDGLQQTLANERLGIVGWNDQERYVTALVGVNRETAHTSGNLEVAHGIGGGSRTVTLLPIQGTFDPHYATVKASFSGWVPVGQGWVARGGVSGQVSSAATPTNELWTIGGSTRGQAYRASFAAGIRGYAVWAQAEAPTIHGLVPFVGIDRAQVSYAGGGADTAVNSGYAGVRYRWDTLAVNLGYAHAFGADVAGQAGHRILATVNYAF